MKKILFSMLAGLLALSTFASAAAQTFTREDGVGGNVMLRNNKVLATGTYPGSLGALTIPFITMVDINMGEPVALVATTITSSTTANPVVVSGTSTAGDKNVLGVVVMPQGATATATAGSVVQVAIKGVALGRVGYTGSVAKNTGLCASGTAGKLTPCSSVTETTFTQISNTAVVGRALETKTISAGDGYILMLVK